VGDPQLLDFSGVGVPAGELHPKTIELGAKPLLVLVVDRGVAIHEAFEVGLACLQLPNRPPVALLLTSELATKPGEFRAGSLQDLAATLQQLSLELRYFVSAEDKFAFELALF